MSLYVLDTTNGLKIAAMVLENRASLVTRNRSHFKQIPELQFEGWSKSGLETAD